MSLMSKLLAGMLALSMAIGAGIGVYAAYEHSKVQDAQLTALTLATKQAQANAAAAASDAAATRAAFGLQASAQAAAKQDHAATTARLASAVGAYPAASEVVPEGIWTAIYGDANEAK